MEGPGSALQRCEDVWYDDGTVVLQAENTVFKVYRGVLKEQSPFFQDLFTLPQQESDQSEKYEDCPLVTMPDKADDVRNFLKAIFDHKFYADVKTITDFNVILSVVKLSHKYQVEYLLRRSLPSFTALYPASLKNWDIRTGRRQYKPLMAAYGRALPIFVIQLARSIGVDILLPAAFLECCSFSTIEILGGVPAPDGRIMCLDTPDQIMVIQARENLSKLARTKIFSFVYSEDTIARVRGPPIGGNAPNHPPAHRHTSWRRVHEWVQGLDCSACWKQFPTLYFPWSEFSIATGGVKRWAERECRNARHSAWNEIPTMFGMPPWDKMKRETLRN